MNPIYSNYFVTHDHVRIFYCTNFKPEDLSEDDSVLVFNNGLACSSQHWEKQFEYFHELGYNILYHDYRGHFQSSGRDQISSCTFANLSLDIKLLLDSLEIKNVIMLGHSMGANLTLEFAKLYPEILKGIVLISASIFPPSEVIFDSNFSGAILPLAEKFNDKYPEIMDMIWKSTGLNPLITRFIYYSGFNHKRISLEYVERYLMRVSQLDFELFHQMFNELCRHDILAYLHEIKTPTLVMGGDKDTVFPFYLQSIIDNELPHSEIYLIKDGSHVPQSEFPEYTNERIALFLEQQLTLTEVV